MDDWQNIQQVIESIRSAFWKRELEYFPDSRQLYYRESAYVLGDSRGISPNPTSVLQQIYLGVIGLFEK